MKETVDAFEDFSLDDEERYRAFRREMAIMDRKAEMKDAYEEGMEQGIEQGLEQGIEQGLKQGIEQGKQELVLNMLRTGISIEEIASMTNIPADLIGEWGNRRSQ
ncbi:RpnC/YadD family protein [Diplocloster agilis]|uniref:Essential protein Yae1 N-terminal domain-containing protein n=1 Tax=Diplocloster agilis TaxID=2850323 RepID=A0A949K5M5_9FIRM|nr:hypothetical protein [Diplocloster agilis]MBU9735112.1 hypothetical protein [Diplocloster agilis]